MILTKLVKHMATLDAKIENFNNNGTLEFNPNRSTAPVAIGIGIVSVLAFGVGGYTILTPLVTFGAFGYNATLSGTAFKLSGLVLSTMASGSFLSVMKSWKENPNSSIQFWIDFKREAIEISSNLLKTLIPVILSCFLKNIPLNPIVKI